VHGQDAQLSQFYASPLVQNPAFAGTANRPRAFFQFRSQWAGTGQPIKTSVASGDLYIKEAKSGLGLVFARNTALNGVYQGTEARLAYSFMQKLSKRWSASYGLQLGLDQRNLGYSRLTFGDQIDTTGRFSPSIDPSASDRNFVVPEVGGGLLLYDQSNYLSVSARHLNNPKLSSDFGSSRLPVWIAVTGGHVWNLGDGRNSRDYYPPEFTLAFLYKRQGPFQQLDLGGYYTLQPLVVGLWYRGIPVLPTVEGVFNHDALTPLLGIHQDNLTIGYTYDINLSGLVQAYAGSHELSLSYTFEQAAPRRKRARALPCPSF
jgi:type IX secretion system PorP/SprF family membrane protein